MKRSIPDGTPALVAIMALLAGCGSLLGPGSTCIERDGLRICTNRSEYRQGQDVSATITNRGNQTLYLDVCSVHLVGSTESRSSFPPPEYDPERQCGLGVTLDEIVAQMRLLAPEQELVSTVRVPPGIFQGFFRVRYWFLDEQGQVLPGSPHESKVFDVLLSAG